MLTLVHAAPTLNTLYGATDRSDDFAVGTVERVGMRAGDLLVVGHTHPSWHRDVHGMHFVNTVSVGRPKDGDWRAGHTIVTIGDVVEVSHIRVAYDVERTIRAIRESSFPPEFADDLSRGGRPSTGSLNGRCSPNG